MTDLATRLLAATPRLNTAALADENADPFWWDRYGERGQQFMLEDGEHHFRYLAEAVRAGHPHVLVRYARWLRSVMLTRGMCSEHLADGLRVRARHIAAEAWPDASPALALVDAAVASLEYTAPPAAGLAPAPGGPAFASLSALATDQDLELAAVRFDARHILSYLADALALARPDLLHDHLHWRRGFEVRRGRSADYLPAHLDALTPHVHADAAALLRAAREALP